MTITVQVAGLRQDLAAAEPQQVSDFIALTTPSKVLIDLSPSDIVAMTRAGSSLVVDRVGGEPLEVLGFFANGSGQSQLYVPDEEGGLLMASMSAANGSDSLSTMFVEASDESMRFDPDVMMADAQREASDDTTISDNGWQQGNEPPRDEAFLAAGSSGAQGQAERDFQIDEVFLDEGFDTADGAPEVASDPAGSGWLDGLGIGPDLLGFIGFGVALGAHRATHSTSSSADPQEDDSREEVPEGAVADGAAGDPADADLQLQEDGDMLVVEGDAESAEAAMVAAPDESAEVGHLSAMVSLDGPVVADDELSVAGQEMIS